MPCVFASIPRIGRGRVRWRRRSRAARPRDSCPRAPLVGERDKIGGREIIQDRLLANRLDLDVRPPTGIAETRSHDILEIGPGIGSGKDEEFVLQQIPAEPVMCREAVMFAQRGHDAHGPEPETVAAIAVYGAGRDHEI